MVSVQFEWLEVAVELFGTETPVWNLTGAPQCLALALHAGTHSSVAERGSALTALSILQKDVGRAVGGGASAELRKVTLAEGLTAH